MPLICCTSESEDEGSESGLFACALALGRLDLSL
eukprot:CAMPEP_0184387744 /NCGR_PEP_ID=MMETSP0007-20130409/11015_1 /TAXON_ID=97485 /ORGANISM="Prymnesium parvum, Strain Texoma1" /LENGTH=33 /DNA_ID= /DNA_START= /DNA_END= /DNA_ORIENTATION=